MRSPIPLLTVLTLTVPAAAQGSDACTSPTPIAGQGVVPFDTTTATTGTEGQNEALCYAFGSSGIDNDVWFGWTPDVDGCAQLATCGWTAVDTKVAIYPGNGCPASGTALACNDDACGLQSSISLQVTSGSTYTLQIGTFPGASGGSGRIEVAISPCPTPVLNPANGHYYLVVNGFVPWDTAKAAAEAMTYLGAQGHLATIADAQEDQFVYFDLAGGPLGNAWLGLYQDMTDPTYSEPAGGWVWVTGEPFNYMNWYAGEPNDGGGAEHYGGYWPADQWNDYTCCDQGVQRYVVEFEVDLGAPYCFGDGSGTACPCANEGGSGEGCANGTGAGAVLSGVGSNSVMADDLGFSGANLLPNQPGLLFAGLNAVNGGAGVLFGDGLRCAGGGVVRLGVRVPDANGDASWGPGLGAQGGWQAGDLRRFQLWYRDPTLSPCGYGFNLSNGYEIQFAP